MPDFLYTSPRTNRSYRLVPDDPNYSPTDLEKQEYAAYIEQQETASEQPAPSQPAPTQPTAEAPDSGQSIGAARLSSAIQGITTIPGIIAQGVGATFLSPFGITSLEESGKYAAEKARELTPIDPKYRGNLSVDLFGAGGQALGQLASAFATGGGTIGTNVALAQAAAMGAASGAESAERRGLTGINRLNEVLGYGASEVITERMFGLGSKSFFKPAAGLQAKAVKAGTTILGEGVEESAAGALTNIVSNLTAVGTNISSPDILSADALKSYARQGLSGLVGGTVFAGAQMAMGEQATQESITRKSAVIDGVFTNVTGVPDEVLIQRGAEDIKLHTFTSPIDAEAIDSAPDGAKVILESIYGNELEVPIGEPTSEQNQAFDEIIAADAAKKAAAAAAAGAPPTTPTEAAVLPTEATAPAEATVPTEAAAETPITPPAVEPTPTPTPAPNATPEGNISESNLGQYPDGNEVGTTTETGDRNRPVEGGQVEQAVAQDETVTQPLPSGALPTETGQLPKTPMTDVSGGVAPGVTPTAAPVGDNTLGAVINTPGQGPIATKAQTVLENVKKNIKAGVPPTASLTPDGNIVFPTPEAAPGVPQQARRTPLNSAVVKQTVQKVFGIVPKNIEFIDTDERVDGKAFVKDQRVQINLRYIQSKERLEKVLREEAFHLIYQDPLVQADVELLKQEIPDDIKAEIDQLYSDPRFTDSVRLEESVARLVERLSEKTAWQRFVGSVRAAFQKLFGRPPSPRELTLAANRILERAIANVAVQQTAEGAQGTEDAGDVRMSFAGEQSLQNLPEEKRRFMTDSLDAAKAMAAAGKSSEEIRAVTGWFPGKYDGKMRYEVPDANASFVDVGTYNEKTTQAYGGQAFNRISIASIAERVKSGKVVKLSDVFQHDALFAAYPEAANIPFFPIAGTAVQGSHRVIDGQDVITATVTIAPDGSISEASASTILHELQHFIQQKEGFAVGGSPDNLITQKDIADAVKFRDAYLGIRKYKSEIDGLVKVLAEERAKKSFVGFGGPNQKVVKSLEDSIARIQESVNSVWEYQKKNLNVDRDSTRASLLSALNLVDSKLGGAWVLTKRNEGLEMLYRLLSGEVEARDVQARKNLTPEQRKATAPYSSENIAKEDAIVMFGSGGPQMSVTPESQRIDQEYLAAVEAGDMETAQRIVDEAAKKAGYTTGTFIHRTDSEFNTFLKSKGWTWFNTDITADEDYQFIYGDRKIDAYVDLSKNYKFDEDFQPWGSAYQRNSELAALEKRGITSIQMPSGDVAVANPNQIKSADPVTRNDAGNIIPPSERFQETSDDIRYSVTPTVQIFGEKVVATAIEVQSRRELMAAVKDKVFDYTQPESAEGDREWRDIMDRWRPTESGPPDLSNFKEIITEDAAPGAVTAALYIYANKKQDGGLALQELRDSIEFSKYFPKEGWIDFWTEAGIGGNVREAGRGLGILAYAVGGLNKAQNVSSNADVQTEAAAKGLDLPESDMRAIDISVNAVPEEGAISGNLDKVTSTGGNSVIDTLTKLLSPSGSTDPTNNPDNSPATDPKSIEQISAQKLVKDATKKDKKPKDTTQTDAVTAIVQDHLEKKGGQLEADLTRKLTEAGMSPEAAKKLATNTEKKLERDAKKESEREAKALEGAKELSDADRVARRITKKLLSTKDEAVKRKIHPIVALVARYFKANGKLSEEQLENELAALGVSTEIGRELVDAATAELGKRQAIKAARDKARRDNAATRSAENFTKNWEKSQDPAQQTKEKTPDPVRAFLNESSKVLRNQIHFDLSPNGKALFFDTVYTRLINFNVSPEAAMAATSAAYQKYLTNRANKIAKLRDTVAKEGLSKALAKQILNLTRTQQRDPEFAKQFIEQTLIDAGVPQDIANASVPLLLPSFQKALADAREKALMDFINGRPPSAKRIPKEKLDDLRKAVRLGATNPDYQPSTPFAKANGWQNFTRAEHDEMARQDEIASDPLQTNQERQLALSKIAKIASKRMPKNNKLSLFAEIYRNSALSNFLSTGGIQVYTPMFAAAVRTFTDGVRGLTQERNLNRFIASLEGFLRAASVPALKAELISSFGQNITTYNKAYEIDDLSQLHKLLLDGIETWKTTKSPLKKAKSLISITYGSMDYVRRSYAALDNVSQSVFYRQIMDLGMRDIILSKGGSETEFKNLISNRTRYHEQLVTELISQGQSPSRAWVNASELSYRQMNGDLVDIYGDDVAVEIQAKDEMSRKEAARELGVAPDEELDGHVIPVLIDTIKGLSKAADKRFAESGKLTTLILFGFPITALKVMNRSLDYSPIGILRGAMSERESKQFANDPEYKSKYPSYKTDTQKQQRMAEAAVGTAAMIMFLMMVLNEREKEPEDRLFMVHNAGPRDRAARQIWRAAGNEPQSVQFRFSKDSPWLGISWAKAGLEVFTPVFATAGATFDSMDPTIRREDAYDQIMVFFSQTLASMSRPLSSIQDTAGVVSGKEMSLSGRSLANQVGFRASSFLPWSSMARNYNKWQGARDTSNAGSAFAAMIPIVGPSLTEPALNSLGDPVGKTPNEYSYKIGTAIPVSVGFRREDTPLYEFLLNKGKFPTTISRPTQEKKYGQMTNETWRKFVEIRGQTLKSLILQRKESLDKMDSEKYDDMIENLTRIANDRARNQLKLRPAKK